MGLLKKIGNFFNKAISVSLGLSGMLIVCIILAVASEITMRYFLNRPQIWVVEFSQYALLYLTFLGTAAVLRNEKHVVLDLLINRLKPRVQVVINSITSTLCTFISLVFVWYGARVFWQYFQSGVTLYSALEIPQAAIIIIIPAGSFLLAIQFIRRTYGYLAGWGTLPEKEKGLPEHEQI